MPAPPRRGSPAAANPRACARRPARRRSRCCARASARAARRPPRAHPASPSGMPPSQSSRSPSGCTRGSSTASCSGSPRSSAATTTWTIAERIRADPDDPATSATPPVLEHERRRHHARQPHPRHAACSEATLRSVSPSMLLRWTPVPGTTTPEPQPVEQVSEAALPCGVEHADLGRPGRLRGQLALAACATWPLRRPRAPAARPRRGRARARTRPCAAAFAERSAAATRADRRRA